MLASPVEINWHPGLPIYASNSYLKNISSGFGWIGGIDDSGELVCILPYSVIKKSIFHLIRFPVQTIPLKGVLEPEQEKKFLNSSVDYFRRTGADLIVPATFNTVFQTYPDGAIVAPFGSFILDLTQTEETLWNNLHSKHRNVIRNAQKKGVFIFHGSKYLESCFRLIRDSFRRSAKGIAGKFRMGFRMDSDAFRQQVLSFGKNVLILVAEYEGVVNGCAVIPYSNCCAYYMHGGSISNPLTGAMNLLQWEAIRLLRNLGVARYDFFGARIDPEKGSKLEGVAKFKERFGGNFVRGYMWKYSFNPLKYYLYSIAACVRSGGDVVDQELHKLEAK